MSTANVESIRADLRTAEALVEQQRREGAQQQIEKLSEEGARLKAEVERLSGMVQRVDEQRAKLMALATRARQEYAAWSTPLDPATFPTKSQKAERAKQAALWKQQLDQLSAQIAALPETFSDRLRAIKLNDQLNGYIYTLKNLTAIATGRKIGSLDDSGLSRISELPSL
ncbi:MAG TPA: hypothetical protein VMU61_09335 [Candidatus Aquilonibacter sp.]|nr:hypothetical protein [Candidatus Aquilonibacter sp.]